MSRGFAHILFALALVFLGYFLLWPLLQISGAGFVDSDGRPTLAYLFEIFSDPIQRVSLAHSILLATCTTGAAAAVALTLAIVSNRFEFPGKRILGSLVLVPVILPTFLGAMGVREALGPDGVVNALLTTAGVLEPGRTGSWIASPPSQAIAIVVIQALHWYPLLYFTLEPALARAVPAMQEAATNLGCTGLRRFRRITLPLIGPGLVSGATLVFIWSFSELGVPLILGYSHVAPVQIYEGLRVSGGSPTPFALAAVMLTVSLLVYFGGRRLAGRNSGTATPDLAHVHAGCRTGRAGAILCPALFAGVIVVALLPHLALGIAALSPGGHPPAGTSGFTLRNLETAVDTGPAALAVANSLRFAGASALVGTVAGIAIGWVLVRARMRGRRLLNQLSMLPLAVPGLVIACGYLAMTRDGGLFAFLDPAADPAVLLVAAYAMPRLPFLVRAAVAGFQRTSGALEEAAQGLGCPPFKSIFKASVPLVAAPIAAGALFVFAFALPEASSSLLLAQEEARLPIANAIFALYQPSTGNVAPAAALGLGALALVVLSIACMGLLLRWRPEPTRFRGRDR